MNAALLEQLHKLTQIAKNHGNLAEGVLADIAALETRIENFRAYVPFLGVFTVGKSSLLNAWLGENLLPEAQGATTALATELLPGSAETMVVVMEDGQERILSHLPTNEDEANAQEASNGVYAYCTSPSINLRDVFPVVPVDMPGLNSGIRRHTEAIYRYANKGSAFFLVFMPEEGTLPAVMKAFLQELNPGDRPIWVIINKCDTAHQEKIDSVTKDICQQLRLMQIEPAGVLHCAKDDADTPQKLQNAFLSLNVERLNLLAHKDEALKIGLRLKDQLSALWESEKLDTAEIDRQIKEYEIIERDLQTAFAREEKKLASRLTNLPVTVSDDVNAALTENLETLVNALEIGEEVFATRITGIINKVVNASIETNLQKDFGEMAMALAADLKIEDSEILNPDKIRQGMQQTTQTLMVIARALKTIQASGKWYKIITGVLAITTSIVAPLVELIIVFLPELLSLFMDKKGMMREKLRRALIDQVFPEIQTSLISELQKELPDMERELVGALRNEWNEKLADVKNALESARASKTEAAAKHDESAAAHDSQVEEINKVLQGVRSLGGADLKH